MIVGLRPTLGGGEESNQSEGKWLVGWFVVLVYQKYMHTNNRLIIQTDQSKDSVAALPNVSVVRVTGIRLNGQGVHWITTPASEMLEEELAVDGGQANYSAS